MKKIISAFLIVLFAVSFAYAGVMGGIFGGGDVAGPASSTDNAIARFHSTTGKILQNGLATIDDDGTIRVTGAIFSGSVSITTTDLGTPALNATATMSGQVASVTIANNCIIDLTSWPASGKEGKKFLYLTNGGAATITWKTGGGALTPKYVGGSAPAFTAAGLDIIALTSIDGGTTVYLSVVGQDYK